ncbi:hypothetical protein HZH66_014344 [Vespula vulgaris]|uniref:Uncharacterized protein n=1 Tax=Vespula vulgaris TaxID=7454 RepID=A0A834J2N0_VESVU|nr:hypothetical protein HZH66_014344 [Vespula vulgaris]
MERVFVCRNETFRRIVDSLCIKEGEEEEEEEEGMKEKKGTIRGKPQEHSSMEETDHKETLSSSSLSSSSASASASNDNMMVVVVVVVKVKVGNRRYRQTAKTFSVSLLSEIFTSRLQQQSARRSVRVIA